MAKGPLILKTDYGPGRLSNLVQNIEFRRQLNDGGIHVFLGLPNGSPNGSATMQEMDQAYAMFQPAFHRSVVRVASVKIAERVLARKKAKANRERPKAADFCALTEEWFADDIEEHEGAF